MSTSEVRKIPMPGAAQASSWIGWVPLVFLPLGAVVLRHRMPAWAFMWVLAIAIYAALKWVSWWRSPVRARATGLRSLGYLIAWPGMDADEFLETTRPVASPSPRDWLWAIGKTALGAVLLWVFARMVPAEYPRVRGWVGLIGMVLLAHFGSFHVVALVWQSFGVHAVPIMSAPLLSGSLSEFWGQRWNLGFRQLAHDLIFRPLHRRLGVGGAGFLVFVASGLIHDFVISLPAGAGYGLPTAYFVIQGAGVALERSPVGKRLDLRRGIGGWLFMAALTAGPAFWLFHPPFLRIVVLPFMYVVRAL
jgi:Membrane bound O-acyl transferase family